MTIDEWLLTERSLAIILHMGEAADKPAILKDCSGRVLTLYEFHGFCYISVHEVRRTEGCCTLQP